MRTLNFLLGFLLICGSIAKADYPQENDVKLAKGQSALLCAQSLSINTAADTITQKLKKNVIQIRSDDASKLDFTVVEAPFAVSAPAVSSDSQGWKYVCVTLTKE